MPALLLLPLLLLSGLPAAAETVEILRDSYGTPHIFATTPAGAAFGAGYAQAQDRGDALLRNLSGAGSESLDQFSPEMRAMLEAYAAGVHRRRADAGVTAGQVAALVGQALTRFRGSSLFLDRTRSASGAAIAILETQANWSADDRPYEMSLHITEGDVAVAGVAPLGVPFPVTGHNRRVAVAWSPGAGGLEQAWGMISARDVEGVRRALGGAVPRDLLAGDASGEVLSAAGVSRGYAMQGERTEQASAAVHKLLAGQNTWSPGRLEDIAFSGEVYKAETWQARLARVDPGHPFTRMLTGWNRRATVDSRPALAFYLFKMELGRDAAALEPPDSLSDARIVAALKRAQDRLETGMAFGSTFGTLFRVSREGARGSHPVGGGTVTEAGMETPRALTFEKRGAVNIANGGQAAVRIVDLADPGAAVSVLMPGVTDGEGSAHFEDQARDLFSKAQTKPAYFGNRRELERRTSSKEQLIF